MSMSLSRADNGALSRWWWTVDRVSFGGILALIAIGLLLAVAASPAATGGSLVAGNFNYAIKQGAFAATAIAILIGAALLDPKQMRNVAAAVFGLALVGAAIALLNGADVNGAHRWINFGDFKLQPSEFLKPAFAILAATFLADKLKRGFPGELVTLVVLAPAIVVLLLQPDVGQTALLTILCIAMLFFGGLAYYWIAALGAGASALAVLAYLMHPHVRERIASFLNHDDPGFQASLALKAFQVGGVTGVGPGAGVIKYRLPEANSDFIYAVAGEEFGLWLCAAIAAFFGLVTVRLLLRAAKSKDQFTQLAGAGLALVVGIQAFINMGVALSILPAKGMTLPFISYGGSSLFAVALTLGLALGVTRQRPQVRGGARA